MKILILTSKKTANIYLVNNLTSRKDVVAKVIENRPDPQTQKEKMDIRVKMIKRYGLLKTVNKLLYNKVKSSFNLFDGDYVKSELFGGNNNIGYQKEIPTLTVPSINDDAVVAFVKKHQPDIIAVCGTGVIKPKVFKLAKFRTINIHCGITPEYRSADPIFWALYNNEPDKVGVTIHFVDEGLDTGDIIYQKPVGVTMEDTLTSLYCKCIKTGAELMLAAIDDMEKNRLKNYRKEGAPDRMYRHIDLGLWEYLVYWTRRKFFLKNILLAQASSKNL